jgi:hypothetical protein
VVIGNQGINTTHKYPSNKCNERALCESCVEAPLLIHIVFHSLLLPITLLSYFIHIWMANETCRSMLGFRCRGRDLDLGLHSPHFQESCSIKEEIDEHQHSTNRKKDATINSQVPHHTKNCLKCNGLLGSIITHKQLINMRALSNFPNRCFIILKRV